MGTASPLRVSDEVRLTRAGHLKEGADVQVMQHIESSRRGMSVLLLECSHLTAKLPLINQNTSKQWELAPPLQTLVELMSASMVS